MLLSAEWTKIGRAREEKLRTLSERVLSTEGSQDQLSPEWEDCPRNGSYCAEGLAKELDPPFWGRDPSLLSRAPAKYPFALAAVTRAVLKPILPTPDPTGRGCQRALPGKPMLPKDRRLGLTALSTLTKRAPKKRYSYLLKGDTVP